jgi:alanine transaminase
MHVVKICICIYVAAYVYLFYEGKNVKEQTSLCSAYLELLNGQPVGYHADEMLGWGLNVYELDDLMRDARKAGIEPRAMVIINPGNPTGHVLSYENLVDIIRFCHCNR